MRKRLHLVVVLICLVLSACSSGKSSGTPSTPAVTYPAYEQPRDAGITSTLGLTIDDVPEEFRLAEAEPDYNLYPAPNSLAACDKAEFPRKKPVVTNAKTFIKNGDSPTLQKAIGSSGMLFRKAKDARVVRNTLTNPSNQFCVQRIIEPVFLSVLNKQMGIQSVPTNIHVAVVPELSAGDVFVLRASGTVVLGRQASTAYMDVIYHVRDRSHSVAFIAALDGAPSIEIERALTASLREHVAIATTKK